MEKDRISEFLESIDSEKWNCVYQANGMTLLTTKEYDYKYKERVNLQTQLKKQKDNWNKLKEYIGTEWYSYDNDSVEFEVAKDILDKMEEMIGGDK